MDPPDLSSLSALTLLLQGESPYQPTPQEMESAMHVLKEDKLSALTRSRVLAGLSGMVRSPNPPSSEIEVLFVDLLPSAASYLREEFSSGGIPPGKALLLFFCKYLSNKDQYEDRNFKEDPSAEESLPIPWAARKLRMLQTLRNFFHTICTTRAAASPFHPEEISWAFSTILWTASTLLRHRFNLKAPKKKPKQFHISPIREVLLDLLSLPFYCSVLRDFSSTTINSVLNACSTQPASVSFVIQWIQGLLERDDEAAGMRIVVSMIRRAVSESAAPSGVIFLDVLSELAQSYPAIVAAILKKLDPLRRSERPILRTRVMDIVGSVCMSFPSIELLDVLVSQIEDRDRNVRSAVLQQLIRNHSAVLSCPRHFYDVLEICYHRLFDRVKGIRVLAMKALTLLLAKRDTGDNENHARAIYLLLHEKILPRVWYLLRKQDREDLGSPDFVASVEAFLAREGAFTLEFEPMELFRALRTSPRTLLPFVTRIFLSKFVHNVPNKAITLATIAARCPSRERRQYGRILEHIICASRAGDVSEVVQPLMQMLGNEDMDRSLRYGASFILFILAPQFPTIVRTEENITMLLRLIDTAARANDSKFVGAILQLLHISVQQSATYGSAQTRQNRLLISYIHTNLDLLIQCGAIEGVLRIACQTMSPHSYMARAIQGAASLVVDAKSMRLFLELLRWVATYTESTIGMSCQDKAQKDNEDDDGDDDEEVFEYMKDFTTKEETSTVVGKILNYATIKGHPIAAFLPLVTHICTECEQFPQRVAVSAFMTFGSMMKISSEIANTHADLVFRLLKNTSASSVLRSNAIVILGELIRRTCGAVQRMAEAHLSSSLHDHDGSVRKTALFVLCKLIHQRVLKLEEKVVELAELSLSSNLSMYAAPFLDRLLRDSGEQRTNLVALIFQGLSKGPERRQVMRTILTKQEGSTHSSHLALFFLGVFVQDHDEDAIACFALLRATDQSMSEILSLLKARSLTEEEVRFVRDHVRSYDPGRNAGKQAKKKEIVALMEQRKHPSLRA